MVQKSFRRRARGRAGRSKVIVYRQISRSKKGLLHAHVTVPNFIALFYSSLQNAMYHECRVVQILFLEEFVNSVHIRHACA